MTEKKNCLDLVLINPSLEWKKDKEKRIAVRIEENLPNQEIPHIGIAYLLGIAKRAGISFQYIDMVADEKTLDDVIIYLQEKKPRLIGFTAFTVQIKSAAIIAARIKEKMPDSFICVGGPHASTIPKETLEEFAGFDFVVCGEAEAILPALIKISPDITAIEKIPGVFTRNSKKITSQRIEDLDSLPYPAWDNFDLAKYPGAYPHRTNQELPMITSRGCPYRCTFCCRALGNTQRRRSVASVIAEIEFNIEHYGCESIAFLDETLTANPKWTNDFFDTMISSGLNKRISWSCSTRVSGTSAKLFKRMREAGCYYVFLGLESADNETLKQIKKMTTVTQIRSAVKWAKQAGIVPVGAFIIGLPGDTEAHVLKAIKLAKELELYSVTFPIAVPFPGTELRKMAEKGEYGMRIISNDWDDYGKQRLRAMESADLSLENRVELQKLAYRENPKKKLIDYQRECL